MHNFMMHIINLLSQDGPVNYDRLAVCVLEIFQLAFPSPYQTVPNTSKIPEMIRNYIDVHIYEKITLDDIAEQVYMSKSHVSKIFNEEMGVSLTAFINGIRVEKAKILLSDASLSVADIAQLTGFEDQSYFTKQFKLLTGLSPKKYREKLS